MVMRNNYEMGLLILNGVWRLPCNRVRSYIHSLILSKSGLKTNRTSRRSKQPLLWPIILNTLSGSGGAGWCGCKSAPGRDRIRSQDSGLALHKRNIPTHHTLSTITLPPKVNQIQQTKQMNVPLLCSGNTQITSGWIADNQWLPTYLSSRCWICISYASQS